MMTLFILGLCMLLIGVILLTAPAWLSRASQFLNREVFDDSVIVSHRLLVAVIFVAVGVMLLLTYVGHYVR